MNTRRIGIISDTHGNLPDSARAAFKGVDAIIHAGDIGKPILLKVLENIAPVYAVAGNMDRHWRGAPLPSTRVVALDDALVYVLHDLDLLDLDPGSSDICAVINGHTHRPAITEKRGVLYINPGSAGHPRDHHPPTVAILTLTNGTPSAQLLELE
jgi:putative phosphoesterase